MRPLKMRYQAASKQAFLRELEDYAQHLRALIAAQVSGFSAQDSAKRVAQVLDKTMGFEFFCCTYFPHYVRHRSKSQLHEYLFERLPQIAANPHSCSEVIAAPRGEAKSTYVTQLHTLWRMVTEQTKMVLLVMDSIEQAYPMLETIKAELESNPRLAMDFPQACGAGRIWQAGTIVSNNNIKVVVAGAGKKLRGLRHGQYRPDLVVLDDIENDEQVQNPVQRDKLQRWLERTITPLGGTGEKLDIIYIGTVLHYDSVLNRTLKNHFWHGKKFQAILDYPHHMDLWEEWETLWRNEGQAAAQAFFQQNETAMRAGAKTSWAARDILELMIKRAKIGLGSFASEYQNDPSSGEHAPFAALIDGCYFHQLPPDVVYFGALDPSLGKSGQGDPSAILVGAYQKSTGILFVEAAKIKRRLPDLMIEEVIALQQQYHCHKWAVETVQFQAFFKDELVKRGSMQNCPIPAVGVKPHTDKTLRIESLQPYFANGLIKLRAEQKILIEQLRHFPYADHDDGADALKMLWDICHTGQSLAQVIDLPLPKF